MNDSYIKKKLLKKKREPKPLPQKNNYISFVAASLSVGFIEILKRR